MSPDAGGRLVGGRWTLHTPLRRAQRGLLWRATDPHGYPLAIEELHLPTSPVPDEDGPHAQAAGEAAAGGVRAGWRSAGAGWRSAGVRRRWVGG